MIYAFDSRDRLKDIKLHYDQVKELRNSFSEKRSKYRTVANILKFNFRSLERSYKEFEKSLLINCYTFMEQLIKSYIYHLLEKGTNENSYINNFIENKINSDKFSPNVKLETIKKILTEELGVRLEFLIVIENSKIEKYDELIKSRHKYAHSGNYYFDFYNFKEVIEVIEYLRFEIYSDIECKGEYKKFKILITKIRKQIDIFNKNTNQSKQYLKRIVVEIRKDLSETISLSKYLGVNNIALLKKIPEDLDKIKNIDLRNYNKSLDIINNISL